MRRLSLFGAVAVLGGVPVAVALTLDAVLDPILPWVLATALELLIGA